MRKINFESREKWWRKEVESISTTLYDLDDNDQNLRYWNLKWYRDELFRVYVIYIHLSIEDLIEEMIYKKLKTNSVFKKSQLKKAIEEDIPSIELINWAARLRLVSKRDYDLLVELNRIRNKCSHNWVLNSHVYRKTKNKKRISRSLVDYNGKNLLNKKVFFEEFGPVYTSLYLKFYRKHNR